MLPSAYGDGNRHPIASGHPSTRGRDATRERERARATRESAIVRVVLLFLSGLYLAIVVTVMLPAREGTPRGILKGWGDTAYHLDIIETLAAGGLVRLEQPIASGTALTYPFFIDWVSAGLRNVGAPMLVAFHIPAIAFGAFLVWALWRLGKQVLRREILALAFIAIVLFGGGLGFLQFFKDAAAGAPFSHEYTHLDNRTGGKPASMDSPLNIVWIVPAISFFSHQRSFIPGAALGALMLWGLSGRGKNRWRWLLGAGFLPLIHTHTFLAFAMILPVAVLFEIREWRQWLPWGIGAAAIAMPQVWWLLRGSAGGSFFQWAPGWMAAGYENVLWFWTKNFGAVFWGWVMVLLQDTARPSFFWTKNFGAVVWRWVRVVVVMLIDWGAGATPFRTAVRSLQRLAPAVPRPDGPPLRGGTKPVGAPQLLQSIAAAPLVSESIPESSRIRPLAVASVVIFAAANLVQFQPWPFDNNKVFFWWWLLAALLILEAIGELIDRRRSYGILILAAVVSIGTCAGFLDVGSRIVRFRAMSYGFYGAPEIEAAEWIRAHTVPSDVFLTGDQANNFVPMLAGRRIYLGFPGWLWTQGRWPLVRERQDAIREFLTTGAAGRLCRDGVRYVVWDRGLTASYPEADLSRLIMLVERVWESARGEREIFKLPCD